MNEEFNFYRRSGKEIYIKAPEFKELIFVKEFWSDRKNMGEFGREYYFPKDKWESFYEKMVYPGDGKNFYCLVYNNENKPIGEVSFHGYNPVTKVARINVKIHYNYRQKGYGREAIRLLLEYYFLEFGGKAIIDTVKSNEGRNLLRKLGFEEISNFKNQATYKLTKKGFLNFKEKNEKTIGILMYEECNLFEYTLIIEIFKKLNELLNKEYFKVQTISYKESLNINKANISIDKIIEKNLIVPNILFILGGNLICNEKDISLVSNFLKDNYNCFDYICVLSSGRYLFEYYKLGGISIPINKNKQYNSLEFGNSLSDNGKFMISYNLNGSINLCLSLIRKILGDDIYIQISRELGYFI